MKIATGLNISDSVEKTIEQAKRLRDLGIRDVWSSQVTGPDTLTALAIVGRDVPELNVGTAVIPIQPRHPAMLAAQARTVQGAIGGQLSLGVGLSHQVMVVGMWGLSFDRPASFMHEYLEALGPMLRGETLNFHGERVTAVTTGEVGPRGVRAPSLLVAALGPKMLESAGALTDGTLLWMTGRDTVRTHVAPRIRDAAAAAGRPEPRIVCALPVCVTSDVAGARERINKSLAIYPTLPSYAAMMAKEGATEPADVALIGSKDQVREMIGEVAAAGATEFSANTIGTSEERDATLELLAECVR